MVSRVWFKHTRSRFESGIPHVPPNKMSRLEAWLHVVMIWTGTWILAKFMLFMFGLYDYVGR